MSHQRLHMSCSGTPCTTPCTREPRSSAVDIGRPSTGSALYATRPWLLLVAGAGSMVGTAGTSIDCQPRSPGPATRAWSDRSSKRNFVGRLPARSPSFSASRPKRRRWSRRSNGSCASSRPETSTSLSSLRSVAVGPLAPSKLAPSCRDGALLRHKIVPPGRCARLAKAQLQCDLQHDRPRQAVVRVEIKSMRASRPGHPMIRRAALERPHHRRRDRGGPHAGGARAVRRAPSTSR
jgi:hypothetical protein